MTERSRRILGWLAVGLSVIAAGFWAFWGIVENFHEGWYSRSPWMNLGVMLAQYLLPMILFMGAALIGIQWPRIGGGAHIAAAVGATWFFRGASAAVLYPFIVGPLTLVAIAYWFGRPQPRRRAVTVVVGVPLIN